MVKKTFFCGIFHKGGKWLISVINVFFQNFQKKWVIAGYKLTPLFLIKNMKVMDQNMKFTPLFFNQKNENNKYFFPITVGEGGGPTFMENTMENIVFLHFPKKNCNIWQTKLAPLSTTQGWYLKIYHWHLCDMYAFTCQMRITSKCNCMNIRNWWRRYIYNC